MTDLSHVRADGSAHMVDVSDKDVTDRSATATATLRVATHVLAAPFYTVGQVVWQAATLDFLSGGRFELGLGAGRPGAAKDAERLGLPFGSPAERVTRLETLVDGVRKAFADDSYPRPVQRPHPPICIGGSGEKRTLRITARYAQHWNFVGGPPDVFKHKREVLASHCADIGRDRPAGTRLVESVTIEQARTEEEVRGRAEHADAAGLGENADFPVAQMDAMAEQHALVQ